MAAGQMTPNLAEDGSMGPGVTVVGHVIAEKSVFAVQIDPEYRPALAGLDQFGHVIVTWLADRVEELAAHDPLVIEETPYVDGPDNVGVFATRSPNRPSPIGLSVAAIIAVDEAAGTVALGWIDAVDGTPVVDLKPYFPSSDRVRDATVPGWCASWPTHLEDSAHFDWESVIRPS